MDQFSCPQCRATNRPLARFCDSCGARLAALARSPPGDELKPITILFADLVGSTELIAGLDPEQARHRLTPAVQAMADAIRTFGGIVNQVSGDGVMALFGAPLSQEDHALRACRAALRMHEATAGLRPTAWLRIGIASGMTLLSPDGTGIAGAYSAFGDIIHVASRLQAMAPPGATLCSSAIVSLAGAAIDAQPLGEQTVRGLPHKEPIFVLRGVAGTASRFTTAVARGLSPFAGRQRELALLRRCAALARAGQGGILALVGEAGIGKSRLAWELAQSLDRDGWQVLRASTASHGGATPYLPITALLRSCFGVDDREDPAQAAQTVGAALDRLGGVPPLTRSALLSLLDLPVASPEWDQLDPLRRRDTLRDGVGGLLHALAQRRPVLVLIEDLHWADEESLRLLDLGMPATGRLLLAVTYRTGFDPNWQRLRPALLALTPLPPDAMTQLAAAILDRPAQDALAGALVARADGNPFFLEEMARAALATTAMAMPGEAAPAFTMPSTVQAVLAERIDRLAPDDKHLLQVASALGVRFPADILQTLFGDRPPSRVQEGIARLREAGLLRPALPFENDLSFAHALTQDVAYGSLPRDRRRRLHADILRAMAAVYAGRAADHAETLAFHAHRGEIWDEAARHATRAGRKAASRSAYRDAAAFFEQAIQAYERQPQSDDILAHLIDVRFELRNALFPISGISKNLAHSREAERLARQLGDRRRLAWATAVHARDLMLNGRPTDALHRAEFALTAAREDGDEELVVVTRSYMALAAYSLGDYTRSAIMLGDLVASVESGDRLRRYGLPGPAAIFFRGWRAWALSRTGAAGDAQAAAAGMLQLALECDQPLCLTVSRLTQGIVHAHAGQLGDAQAALRISLDLCRKWEFFAWFTNIAACLGHVLSRLGAFEEGINLLEQAIDRTKSSGILVSHANEIAWLADAHRLAGRPDAAARLATEAVAVARTHEERGNEALARCVLAEALQQCDDGWHESAAQFRAAMALAETCGMAPLAERCQHGLAAVDAHLVA